MNTASAEQARVLHEPTWTQPGDALTEVLRDLRLVQSFYCHSELTAPWGLGMPAEDHAVFHFVADGEAWLAGLRASNRYLEDIWGEAAVV